MNPFKNMTTKNAMQKPIKETATLFQTLILVVLLAPLFSGCSKDSGDGSTTNNDSITHPTEIKNIDLSKLPPETPTDARPKPLEDGIAVNVILSDRRSDSKAIALNDFSRTLEGTRLTLSIKATKPILMNELTTFTLFGQGILLDRVDVTLNPDQNTVTLSFTTPWIGSKQRADGFDTIPYEIMVSNSKHDAHLPFSIKIYDAKTSTYILPRDASCSIYNKPEPASGCFQNRTRTTQEVVFMDSVATQTDTSIAASGGLLLTLSVVQAQFGLSKTVTQSQATSRGSEIHFTNCIECSSMVFRQVVETIRKGDVYSVKADGSLAWIGDVTYHSNAVAYEFSSTGSESKDYSCNIQSLLPVGRTPSCDDLAKGI